MSTQSIGTFLKDHLWFVIAIAILLILTLYFGISKGAQARKHNRELENMRQQYENQFAAALAKESKDQLTLMLTTFVWAVRGSMLRENLDEVNQYLIELVKEDEINEIVLAGDEGQILLATNKKNEGQPFGNFYSQELLTKEQVYFKLSEDKQDYYIVAPVLSLNRRLGTLFMKYNPERLNWDVAKEPTPGKVNVTPTGN